MSVGVRLEGTGGGGEVSRRRVPRWSMGHLAVAVAALLAFVANLAFLRTREDATEVVVAARPIEAGQVVVSEDLGTARLRADAGILATLLTSLDGVEGRVARRSITEGELVGSSDLLTGAAPDGLASMSVPIEPAHAAGSHIRVGDRVDVVDIDEGGRAGFVVRGVPVLALSDATPGALAAVGQEHLVLGLSHDQILPVAEAIADGEVDVVVTTGSVDG